VAQITVTFQDASGTGTSTVTLSNADMDRMISAHRQMLANPDGSLGSKQQALKQMVKNALTVWKNSTRNWEQSTAVNSIPPIPDIPITEVP
jgi:hypothetical protein